MNQNNHGFIQGRLSPVSQGKIQEFPWKTWKNEFILAYENKWPLMEWTLDYENIRENPLATEKGRKEIAYLCNRYELKIPSITGDFIMQKPFYKCKGEEYDEQFELLKDIIGCAHAISSEILVVPLVDNGSVEELWQMTGLLNGLRSLEATLRKHKMKIAFEFDLPAKEVASFMSNLDPDLFGVNYDIGNSASCGYDAREEVLAYGDRITNVHVKDRVFGGTTVPLGEGNADFETVFEMLDNAAYKGNFIFQTARSKTNEHVACLNGFRKYIEMKNGLTVK